MSEIDDAYAAGRRDERAEWGPRIDRAHAETLQLRARFDELLKLVADGKALQPPPPLHIQRPTEAEKFRILAWNPSGTAIVEYGDGRREVISSPDNVNWTVPDVPITALDTLPPQP
jgi:hypothetical protein